MGLRLQEYLDAMRTDSKVDWKLVETGSQVSYRLKGSDKIETHIVWESDCYNSNPFEKESHGNVLLYCAKGLDLNDVRDAKGNLVSTARADFHVMQSVTRLRIDIKDF